VVSLTYTGSRNGAERFGYAQFGADDCQAIPVAGEEEGCERSEE
jgi:hypothetical protein